MLIYLIIIWLILKTKGIGDWGLGIGPNPQSPIPNPRNYITNKIAKLQTLLNI